MTDLAKLIADIEVAQEGSRELDARIAVALGFEVEQFLVPADHPMLTGGLEFRVHPDGARDAIPPYSRNLQATTDTVPAKCDFELGSRRKWFPHDREYAYATLTTSKGGHHHEAATPALALCAAILRAKEATQK